MKNEQTSLDLSEPRMISRTDNNPPEVLPEGLPAVAELGIIIKKDVDASVEKAILELDTYSRVPQTIENDEIYQRVTTLTTRIKEVLDGADAKRKEHKDPYLKAGKLIDESFGLVFEAPDEKPRNLKKEMEAARESLKSRLSDYDTRKYLEEQKAIEEERASLSEQAAKDGIVMDATEEVGITATVKSAHGGQSVRKVVTEWEVVDETLLPRSVLSVDPAKVLKLIEGGAKEIPGIKLSKKVDTHVRK